MPQPIEIIGSIKHPVAIFEQDPVSFDALLMILRFALCRLQKTAQNLTRCKQREQKTKKKFIYRHGVQPPRIICMKSEDLFFCR